MSNLVPNKIVTFTNERTSSIGVEALDRNVVVAAGETITLEMTPAQHTRLDALASVTISSAVDDMRLDATDDYELLTTIAGDVTLTHSVVTTTGSTQIALAANANRKYVALINDSDTVMYAKVGSDAVLNQGIRINENGGAFELSANIGNLDLRVINVICTSADKILLVTEGI